MKDFLFKHNAIEYVIEDKENENQKKLTYEKWRMERHKFFLRRQHICLTFSYKNFIKHE